MSIGDAFKQAGGQLISLGQRERDRRLARERMEISNSLFDLETDSLSILSDAELLGDNLSEEQVTSFVERSEESRIAIAQRANKILDPDLRTNMVERLSDRHSRNIIALQNMADKALVNRGRTEYGSKFRTANAPLGRNPHMLNSVLENIDSLSSEAAIPTTLGDGSELSFFDTKEVDILRRGARKQSIYTSIFSLADRDSIQDLRQAKQMFDQYKQELLDDGDIVTVERISRLLKRRIREAEASDQAAASRELAQLKAKGVDAATKGSMELDRWYKDNDVDSLIRSGLIKQGYLDQIEASAFKTDKAFGAFLNSRVDGRDFVPTSDERRLLDDKLNDALSRTFDEGFSQSLVRPEKAFANGIDSSIEFLEGFKAGYLPTGSVDFGVEQLRNGMGALTKAESQEFARRLRNVSMYDPKHSISENSSVVLSLIEQGITDPVELNASLEEIHNAKGADTEAVLKDFRKDTLNNRSRLSAKIDFHTDRAAPYILFGHEFFGGKSGFTKSIRDTFGWNWNFGREVVPHEQMYNDVKINTEIGIRKGLPQQIAEDEAIRNVYFNPDFGYSMIKSFDNPVYWRNAPDNRYEIGENAMLGILFNSLLKSGQINDVSLILKDQHAPPGLIPGLPNYNPLALGPKDLFSRLHSFVDRPELMKWLSQYQLVERRTATGDPVWQVHYSSRHEDPLLRNQPVEQRRGQHVGEPILIGDWDQYRGIQTAREYVEKFPDEIFPSFTFPMTSRDIWGDDEITEEDLKVAEDQFSKRVEANR